MSNSNLQILYSVQATGNGHISRASEVYPYLSKYGNVDVLLSGSNCNLPVNMPVKYRLPGISLFYKQRWVGLLENAETTESHQNNPTNNFSTGKTIRFGHQRF